MHTHVQTKQPIRFQKRVLSGSDCDCPIIAAVQVLAQQEHLERSEQIRMEHELHKQLVAERAQARYRKHFDICRGILGQIVDLATKAGEYRLLTSKYLCS